MTNMHYCTTHLAIHQWRNRNSGGPGQNIPRRVPLLAFPYPPPPIPFKGLPSEIFMLAYGVYTLPQIFTWIMN